MWADKAKAMKDQIKVLRIYLNKHYTAEAIINPLESIEMPAGLTSESRVLESAKAQLNCKKSMLDKSS